MVSTLIPGEEVFSAAQVERARRYHRPIYVVRVLGIALGLLVLGLLSVGAAGDALYGLVDSWPWWAAALAFPALIVVVQSIDRFWLTIVTLPPAK